MSLIFSFICNTYKYYVYINIMYVLCNEQGCHVIYRLDGMSSVVRMSCHLSLGWVMYVARKACHLSV